MNYLVLPLYFPTQKPTNRGLRGDYPISLLKKRLYLFLTNPFCHLMQFFDASGELF